MSELLKLLASLAVVELRTLLRRRREHAQLPPEGAQPWTYQDVRRVNDIARAAGPPPPPKVIH